MAIPASACPLDQQAIIDRYFLTHRTQVLDIAAFLDRLARAAKTNGEQDFRLRALRAALAVLSRPGSDYALAIQNLLSDPTPEPLPALDQKSADGAFNDRRAIDAVR